MQEDNIWSNVTKSLGKSLVCSVWVLKNDELAIRSQDGLRFFKLDENQKDWKLMSECDTRFSDKNKFDQERYKLKFFDYQNKTFVSFLTTNNGYVFLELDKSTYKLKKVAVDKRFARKYSTLKMGHFYGSENPLGVFSLDKKIGAAFHFINLKLSKIPIIKHQKTNDILNKDFNWHHMDWKFLFADVNGNGKTNIVAVQSSRIVAYELEMFDCYFKPSELFKLELKMTKDTKFFFGRLTPAPLGSYLDILIIQPDGLYVYKWNSTDARYKLINYSRSFSKANNWTIKHTQSILFSDFDSNGLDKFVYSGPNGLKIEKLEFSDDDNEWTWTCLLDLNSSTTDIGLKHLVPIEIIPIIKSPCKKPILIGNDVLNKKCTIIAIEKQLENDNDNNLDDEMIADENFATSNHVQKLPEFDHKKEFKVEKTVLYLRNVLDIKSIVNSCINPTNAQLQLKLPLIILPVIDEPLSLSYTSVSTGLSSPFGQGWSFGQEFIYAELKSNKALHKFYLITSNGSFVMNRQDNGHEANHVGTEILFNIENRKEKVKFYVDESKWIVENGNEIKIFGGSLSSHRPKGNGIEWTKNNCLKTKSTTIRDDVTSFKWYLTSIQTECDTAMLEYTDGPVVCLKEIKVNESEISVKFDFDQDQLLVNGLKFESKHHIQNIKFNYEIQKDSKHLLKSITQMDDNSQVLQFGYSMIGNSMKMSKIVLPDQLDYVTFDYEDATQKFINSSYKYLKDANLASYEDKDTMCQLNVSNEYSVLSYLTKSKSLLWLSIYTCDKLNFVIKLKALETFKDESFAEYKIVPFAEHFVVWLFDSKKPNDQVVCLCHLDSTRELVTCPKIKWTK